MKNFFVMSTLALVPVGLFAQTPTTNYSWSDVYQALVASSHGNISDPPSVRRDSGVVLPSIVSTTHQSEFSEEEARQAIMPFWCDTLAGVVTAIHSHFVVTVLPEECLGGTDSIRVQAGKRKVWAVRCGHWCRSGMFLGLYHVKDRLRTDGLVLSGERPVQSCPVRSVVGSDSVGIQGSVYAVQDDFMVASLEFLSAQAGTPIMDPTNRVIGFVGSGVYCWYAADLVVLSNVLLEELATAPYGSE